MPRLTLHCKGESRILEAADGELLSGVLHRERLHIPMPCGGRHTCGKCAVRVRGAFSEVEAEEARLLSALGKEGTGAWRMACICRVAGDGEVWLQGDAGDVSVAPEMENVWVASSASEGLGIAVDIGTTTVSLQLYALESGELLAASHALNKQTAYGADVLSRIAYTNEHGIAPLVECIRGQLAAQAQEALGQAGEQAGRVKRLVITGNTTMLHYLMALAPRGIGVTPFTPQSLFGEEVAADVVFGELFPDAALYLPPSISAYVGADVSCGILVSGLCDGGGSRLLVDVGTNGEMAVYDGKTLRCCSTAAGPAFEGANISQGMPALPGAVDKVFFDGGRITCRTLGDAPAKGICGTGLISAISGMLEAGVLDETGLIQDEGHEYGGCVQEQAGHSQLRLGDSGVAVTQQDIRNIQLAKAAIAAGIDTLLHDAGVAASEVEMFCLSGGFGSYMDAQEAGAIGLIPLELVQSAVGGGNTALRGAVRLLFDVKARGRLEGMAVSAQELGLATHPYFMEQYIERMMFEA